MTYEKWKSIIDYFWKYTAPKLGFAEKYWRSKDQYTGHHSFICDNNGQLQVYASTYKVYRIPSLYLNTRVFTDAKENCDCFRVYFFEEATELLHSELFMRR